MRGIIIEEFGGPDRLLYREDLPEPVPGPGEVLVDVEAVGVNFTDVYQREGIYPRPLPFTPGSEGCGRVVAAGPALADGDAPDSTPVTVGDRVAWCTAPDSYAEKVVVPAAACVPVPEDVPADVAASILLQGLTAHFLVNDVGALGEGDTVLLTAGAGGVGLLLTQLAKAAGANVAALVSSDKKEKLSVGAGADLVLRYSDDVPAAIADWTGGRGVDVVYDGVGKATFPTSLECARVRGLVALFGAASGAVPPMDPQELNKHGSLFLTRPHLRDFTRDRGELLMRADDVLARVADGTLHIRVGARHPLADAQRAHGDLQARATTGSVVLLP